MASAPPATPTPAPASDMFAAPEQGQHIADVFGFDPEEDDDEPAPASVGAGEGEGAGGDLEGPPPAPEPAAPLAAGEEPPATPAEPPAVDEDKLKVTSLEQQIADLRAELAESRKPAEPADEPKPLELPKLEPVKVQLPKELGDQILSEDPAEMLAALNDVVSHLATQTRDMGVLVLAEVDRRIQAALGGGNTPPAAPASDGSPAAPDPLARKKQMEEEYYTDFPSHKKPELLPLIAQAQSELATALPGHPWNAEYRAALGARVAAKLKALTSVANGTPPAPPAALPAGTRSAAPAASEQDISDEIEELFSFGD